MNKKPESGPDLREVGYNTGKFSDDDDYSPITPFFGPNR
jgi:hypothetical protein